MRRVLQIVLLLLMAGTATAQQNPRDPASVPSARLTPAVPLRLTGDVDSNSPVVWDRVDGTMLMFVMTSIDGRPSRASGEHLRALGDPESIEIAPWPGGGVWLEAVIQDVVDTWYGFYHNEHAGELMCEGE